MCCSNLGNNAIKNALSCDWLPSFTFHFLSSQGELPIKVNQVKACMISKNALHVLKNDPTMSEIDIKLEEGLSFQRIKEFFEIFNGSVEITVENITDFCKIAKILKTEDVSYDIENIYDDLKSKLTVENVLERLVFKKENVFDYEKELQFCSNYLAELIQKNLFDNFQKTKLFEILFEILSKKYGYKENEQHVIFEYLSTFPKKEFIQLASLLNFKLLNNNDVSFFLYHLNESTFCNEAVKSLYEKFDTGKPTILKSNRITCNKNEGFDGIFNLLHRRCKDNPVISVDIQIMTRNSDIKEGTEALNVLEYEGPKKYKYFFNIMKSQDDTFMIFDFGMNRSVTISGYELMTPPRSNAYNFPKSWVIDGSNDLYKWAYIDNQRDKQDLNGSKKTFRFQIKKPSEELFRYIRYKQIQNHGSTQEQKHMALCAIELYGEIVYK